MAETYDLYDADEFVSVEDAEHGGGYDVRCWGPGGVRFDVLQNVSHNKAHAACDAIATALRTWDGWR
jgi:hypothetical protein